MNGLRVNTGRAYSKSDGKAILIEVKTKTGRLREDQKRFAEYVTQLPFLYGVARSAEDAIRIIEGE